MEKKEIDILRAKNSKYENYLLKDHILEALNQLIIFMNYVTNNKENIGYDYEKFYERLAKAIFIHDLGKINLKFQKKVFNEKDDDEDFKKLNDILKDGKTNKEIDHEILSILWSTFLLNNSIDDKKIRTAVLLHHYNNYYTNEKNIMEIIQDYPEISYYIDFLNSKENFVKNLINDLIEYIKNNINSDIISNALNQIKDNFENNFENLKNLKKAIENHEDDIQKYCEMYEIKNDNYLQNDDNIDFLVFLGILRRCDYAASGNIKIEEYTGNSLDDLFNEVENRIKNKINNGRKFWQNDLLTDLRQKNSIPKLLVLIAPTGSGKTEFALLWGKEMKRKLIYTLPLRVALNDLYDRFKGEVVNGNKEGYFENEDWIDILHSTSFIEYINGTTGKYDIENQINSAKMFSAPALLTTPDQVFLTSLNFYGSDKLISIYPEASIVIDEIQTYNVEMAAIILKTLETIETLHGNVLIITATFPPYFKKFLKNYEIIDIKEKEDGIKNNVKNYSLKRHKIELREENLIEENEGNNILNKKEKDSLLNLIDNRIKNENILIVLNTVKSAIIIFKELEKKYKNNLFLLHSRLIEKEKTDRIEEIKRKLKIGEKVIVVSTQVIEASVDIDFDVLITEVSTIDSQVQRWGRIYRNRYNHYQCEEPNIYVFVGKENNGKHSLNKGTKSIYDENVVEKTIEVLKEYENECLDYEKEREMIDKTFEKELNGKKLVKIYEDNIEDMLKNLQYFSIEKRSEAQRVFRNISGIQFVIPQLMEKENDEHLKEFAKIILSSDRDLSWNDIVKDVYNDENTGKRWELKKWLYEYSVNLPMYYIKNKNYLFYKNFKGFYILSINNDEDLEKIRKYGIDEFFKDIDETLERENDFIING
jgi:CRISPR-associated endonuclease/helicase Cas3